MRSLLVAILFIGLFLAACSEEIEPGTRKKERPVVTGLVLAAAEETPLSEGKSLPGTIQRSTRTTLVARSDGRVSDFSIREGESVEAGETLLTLAENQADARLDSVRSGFEAARAALRTAEAQRTLAERTYERYARLAESEAVTPQEMDRVAAEREAARTAAARAAAEVRAAKSELDSARIARGYTVVTAPFDATVVEKSTRNGATVLPGTPLVTLDKRGGWELLSSIPESLWTHLETGQTVAVRVPSLDLELSGTVAEKLPATDPSSRSFPAKIGLPENDRLQSGMFARLRVPVEERMVLTVPVSSLVERGQLTGVYAVKDGLLEYRLVTTGRRIGDRVEILSGLEPGDRVVEKGADRARDGARIEE